MTSKALRDHMVWSLAATLLVSLAVACSTAVQPAAAPGAGTASAEQERCDRGGGVWKNGICQTSGNGGY